MGEPGGDSRPKNIVDAWRKSVRRAGIQLVDLTGVRGRDPKTGAVVAEDLNKPMTQRKKERNEEDEEGMGNLFGIKKKH